jgi:hypothetical protein
MPGTRFCRSIVQPGRGLKLFMTGSAGEEEAARTRVIRQMLRISPPSMRIFAPVT